MVELLRDEIDLGFERGAVLDHVFGGQRLVGEAHVHHGGGVAFGGRQVHQAAVGEQVELAAVGQHELFYEVAHFPTAPAGHLHQRGDIDFVVEVAAVGQDRAVLHHFHVVLVDHVQVARDGDEDDRLPGRRP